MSWNAGSFCRMACWILAVLVVIGMTAFWENGARAQQADPADAKAPDAAKKPEKPENEQDKTAVEEPETVGMMVVKSGAFSIVFYVALFAFSLVAVTVAMERFLNLRRDKIIPAMFVGSLRELVNRNDASAENFRSLGESNPSPVARILKAGVLRAGRPLPEVEKSMEDAAAREMAGMRGRNQPLNVVGNIAPLVGLLGTVVGMIFAFSTASQVGLGKADELAKGIYLALLTTAGGLTIAIPSMLAAAWFSARVELFMREIDELLLETMPCFAKMENRIIVGRSNEPQASSEPQREAEVVESR